MEELLNRPIGYAKRDIDKNETFTVNINMPSGILESEIIEFTENIFMILKMQKINKIISN